MSNLLCAGMAHRVICQHNPVLQKHFNPVEAPTKNMENELTQEKQTLPSARL